MAAVVDDHYEDPSELGVWEMSVEHPELADEDGQFKLDKGEGKGSLKASYNPYKIFHSFVLPAAERHSKDIHRLE